MVYEINETVTGYLEQLRHIAPELAKELGSKAGDVVRKSMRANLKRHYHSWFTMKSKNNKLYIVKHPTLKKQLGKVSPYGEQKLENVAQLITNYFDEKNSLVVVGGKHKTVHPIGRKDGKITGKRYTLKGIGAESHAILHKLNTGERNKDHGWWMNGVLKKESIKFGGHEPIFLGRHFIEDGIRDTGVIVDNMITEEYRRKITKIMGREKIKVRKIV